MTLHCVSWRYITFRGVTWVMLLSMPCHMYVSFLYDPLPFVSFHLPSTMVTKFTNYTFRTGEGNVTFTVYHGKDCPRPNVGEPGDVCGESGGSDVFVKTTEGWQFYPMNPEPSKRIHHPEHPQRVLAVKDGQFIWTSLSALRVRKWRAADKGVKGQTVEDNPATCINLPITSHDVRPASDAGEDLFNDQSATCRYPAAIPSYSGTIQGQRGIVIITCYFLIWFPIRYLFSTQ